MGKSFDGQINEIITSIKSRNKDIDNIASTATNINTTLSNVNTTLSNVNTSVSNLNTSIQHLNEALEENSVMYLEAYPRQVPKAQANKIMVVFDINKICDYITIAVDGSREAEVSNTNNYTGQINVEFETAGLHTITATAIINEGGKGLSKSVIIESTD